MLIMQLFISWMLTGCVYLLLEEYWKFDVFDRKMQKYSKEFGNPNNRCYVYLTVFQTRQPPQLLQPDSKAVVENVTMKFVWIHSDFGMNWPEWSIDTRGSYTIPTIWYNGNIRFTVIFSLELHITICTSPYTTLPYSIQRYTFPTLWWWIMNQNQDSPNLSMFDSDSSTDGCTTNRSNSAVAVDHVNFDSHCSTSTNYCNFYYFVFWYLFINMYMNMQLYIESLYVIISNHFRVNKTTCFKARFYITFNRNDCFTNKFWKFYEQFTLKWRFFC